MLISVIDKQLIDQKSKLIFAISCSESSISCNKMHRSSSTLLTDVRPCIAQTNRFNETISSGETVHAFPSSPKHLMNSSFFIIVLYGRTLPFPLIALVVSQWANTWIPKSALLTSSGLLFAIAVISSSFLLFPLPVPNRTFTSFKCGQQKSKRIKNVRMRRSIFYCWIAFGLSKHAINYDMCISFFLLGLELLNGFVFSLKAVWLNFDNISICN